MGVRGGGGDGIVNDPEWGFEEGTVKGIDSGDVTGGIGQLAVDGAQDAFDGESFAAADRAGQKEDEAWAGEALEAGLVKESVPGQEMVELRSQEVFQVFGEEGEPLGPFSGFIVGGKEFYCGDIEIGSGADLDELLWAMKEAEGAMDTAGILDEEEGFMAFGEGVISGGFEGEPGVGITAGHILVGLVNPADIGFADDEFAIGGIEEGIGDDIAQGDIDGVAQPGVAQDF